MQLIKARKLWENGEFLGDVVTQFNFTCDLITNSTPRQGWLVPTEGCCGNPVFYSLTLTDPKRTDAIAGVWIEFDNNGVLIDAETVAEVVDKCNGCCGDAPAIDARYDGKFPMIGKDVKQATTYQITRADDGSAQAEQRMRLAYLGEYIEGTFAKVSATGASSVYSFKAYKDPRPKGADVISSEVARTFKSGVPVALGAGEQYELTVVADGKELAPKKTGADVAALAAAATADAVYNALGTWTVVTGELVFTSTKTTEALVSIEKIAV